MKVSVGFGDMRIIVPCGEGDLLISDLIERATNRYKRATPKGGGDTRDVHVKYLETAKERARLDAGDRVVDVCDDKDMLVAVFFENGRHVKIDDVVVVNNDDDAAEDCNNEHTRVVSTLSDNDSGVAADAFGLLSNTDSARASLESSSKPPRGPAHRQPTTRSKNSSSFRSSISSNSPSSSPEPPMKHLLKTNNPFTRDTNRKSLSSNHPFLHTWIDQQEKSTAFSHDTQHNTSQPHDETNDSDKSLEAEEILLDDETMKSIDIRPYTNAEGVEIGLIVQDVSSGHPSELQVADRITEVNGVLLKGMTNSSALTVFNDALRSGKVVARRTRSHSFLRERLSLKHSSVPPPPREPDEIPLPKQVLKRTVEEVKDAVEAGIEAPVLRKPEDDSTSTFVVDLVKGAKGLGFTVTSKDVITSKTTRIFIKNVLRAGAANDDGRIKAGDELLSVNNTSVGGKTQSDVVKLLRQAQGTVSLKLSRPNAAPLPPAVTSAPNSAVPSLSALETPLPSISIEPPTQFAKKPVLSPLLKAAVTSHVNPDPTMSPLTKQLQMSPISPYQQSKLPDVLPATEGLRGSTKNIEQKDNNRSVFDTSGVTRGCINLTVPLTVQEKVGLGISVKGKIIKDSGEEKGIFVKSIVPGTNAEREGRVLVGDQLLSVNSTSLKGVSNQAAMTLLKKTLTECARDGVIHINVNRFVNGSLDSAENESNKSLSSDKSTPFLIKKTKCRNDGERDCELLSSSADKAIGRNISYFKAVNRPQSVNIPNDTNPQVFFQPDQKGERCIGNVTEGGQLWGVNPKELPSYEEAVQSKETQSNSESSPKTKQQQQQQQQLQEQQQLSQQSVRFTTPSVSSDSTSPSQTMTGDQAPFDRGFSAVSVSSLDSVLTDSQRIRFTRDGPGRLSISEKKGRGQIDASDSQFYNKLRKFKSMEELRVTGDDFSDTQLDADLRRTSSIDTITSILDERERNMALFNRGTILSASAPYFGHDEQQRHYSNDQADKAVNQGFQNALDRATSNPIFPGKKRRERDDDKKKKGFLNSLGVLLKLGKKRKEDDLIHGHSPEYITNPDKFPFDRNALLQVYEDVENNNKKIDVDVVPVESNPSKYLQADELQRRLVEDKIHEMQKRDHKDKKEKKYNSLPRGSTQKTDATKGYETLPRRMVSPKSDSSLSARDTLKRGHDQKTEINVVDEKIGFQTWQSHDPKNMREQSKQFFIRDPTNNERHSLPPKNSVEVHRVLPRAPSGPMYKSPSKLKLEYSSQHPPSNTRQRDSAKPPHPKSQPKQTNSRNAHRKMEKDSPQQQQVPVTSHHLVERNIESSSSNQSEISTSDTKVVMRVRRNPSGGGSPQSSRYNPKTTTNRRSMPSMADLKLRSSVTISHQAEI